MIPGEIATREGAITLKEGAQALTLQVTNKGDRPVQVGSHYHFFETDPVLDFDRFSARGMRLDIATGTAVRLEPRQARDVTLISLGGDRKVYGFNQNIMGRLD